MLELTPEQAEEAARMSPAEWSAHQARYRPPDPAEDVRTAVANHVPEDMIDAVMAVVDPNKFLGGDGKVDEVRVKQHFGAFFGTNEPAQQKDWGQHSPTGGPARHKGDTARAALRKRHGVDHAPPDPIMRPGDTARAALRKRHGGGSQQHR